MTKRSVLSAAALGLLLAWPSGRAALAVSPYAVYHQAAANMAAAATFVERSVITERAATLVIGRMVITEFDQQHNRERIHAYETRRTRDAHGVWHERTRYLDIIFLGPRTYVRTTPGLRWQARADSHYTDLTWRDAYSNVAPGFGDLPRAGLRTAGSSHGEVHLLIRTADLSGDLWITVSPTPYLTRYRAGYDRELDGVRTQVQEDSRFYGFNRPLKIVAPVSAAASGQVVTVNQLQLKVWSMGKSGRS